MPTWEELSKFTWEELETFKWEDLKLKSERLLLKVEYENRPLPPETYKKLLTLCNKAITESNIEIPTPQNAISSATKILTFLITVKKFAVAYAPEISAILESIEKIIH